MCEELFQAGLRASKAADAAAKRANVARKRLRVCRESLRTATSEHALAVAEYEAAEAARATAREAEYWASLRWVECESRRADTGLGAPQSSLIPIPPIAATEGSETIKDPKE